MNTSFITKVEILGAHQVVLLTCVDYKVRND